ncbi:uncharacterized protein LTR77_003702 [Saxophila tyrrhenica]|uniref:Uncharacterized protein n=1 Tax=Saxophila tyrrhenica TaxID=1690608 RepID=A0AAV9PEF1_9PEZI|nr:hypothetical protein LTR77_003702 [Saxophila tyrrhenica]
MEKQQQSSCSQDRESLEPLSETALANLNGPELTIKRTGALKADVAIFNDQQQQLFFADICAYGKKPDITLHQNTKEGPVVAAAHYRYGRSVNVGIGPDDLSMTWVELKRRNVLETRGFTFVWNDTVYALRRATFEDHGSTGAGRLLLTHFKVVEEATGEMIALYVSKPVGKTKGTLRLKSKLSGELNVLCIVGVIAWRDKIRRR